MAYAVVEKSKVAATNVESLNRTAKYASAAVEDGSVFQLLTRSTSDRESQVWVATLPATSALDDLWMAGNFGIVTTDSKYRGLTDDPREFRTPAGDPISVFKPQEGDMLLMSADAFSNAKSTNGYANAANAAIQLAWGATQTASALSLKYIATESIPIGVGSSVIQKVTAYKMEVLAN